MSGLDSTQQDHLGVGPIAVRTDAIDVAAFAAALGLRRGLGPVPLTFPIRWLSLPAIRSTVIRGLGLTGEAIVQQAQTFTYCAALATDCHYSFEVEARRERGSADRTLLRGTVRDSTGAVVVSLDTLLRTIRPGVSRDAPRPLSVPESRFPVIEAGPVDLAQTQRYTAASLDDNPLHSDLSTARAAGLDGLIIHGMLAMGQIEGALRAWLPGLRVDRIHGNFLQPVPVGSRLLFSGRVVKRTPSDNSADADAEDLILRVIVCGTAGQAVCVSEAVARHGHGAPRNS